MLGPGCLCLLLQRCQRNMATLFVVKSKEEEGHGLGHLQREEGLLDKKVDFVNLVC